MSDHSDRRRGGRRASHGRPGPGEVEAAEVVRYAPEDQISILELLSVALKYRYLIVASTITVAALAVLHLLITFSPTYTADASFVPEQGNQGISGLEAVAGRFGVNLPSTGRNSWSLQFYEDILESREILRPVVDDTFSVERREGPGARRGTILELLGTEVRDPALRREQGVEWLRDAISASQNPSTGILDISVRTPWPALSEQIARRLLDRVNQFNLETRQSQAAAERRFVEDRMVQVEQELQEAEEDLRRFLEANRQFENSPELRFEHQRLQRKVTMRQEVFNSLAQAYEQARISEVRNTPVITVLEPPQEPLHRDPRGLKRRGLLGLALGGFLGIVIAFGREFVVLTSKEGGSDAYQKLHRRWQETTDDFRSLIPRR